MPERDIAAGVKQVKPIQKVHMAQLTHAMPKKLNGGKKPGAGVALDLSKGPRWI